VNEILPEEKAALMRMYHEEKGVGQFQPLMIWAERPFRGANRKKRPQRLECSLAVMGTQKSVADCLAIRTGLSILQGFGYKNLILRINSIGDRESLAEFERKMTAYIRKNFNLFPSELRQLLKKDSLALLREERTEWKNFQEECPKTLDFLSEQSRIHFKEVIEYLESQEIPFEINKTVVGDPHYSTHTVFTIIDQKTNKILATGTRYDDLSKKTISRNGYPAVSINITLPKLKTVSESKKPNFEKCDFYFIQLGYAAKLKSLEVIELLRKSGIAIHQSIGRDKMATQTNSAHKKEVKYILIMGQKEALENSICVRDQESNSQKTVKLDELIEYIKNIKIKNKK